ncbi:MAG: DUF3793 family protein [Clostridia bacterium]|nr:DUF3793 family protein [Clostridia bacterium]
MSEELLIQHCAPTLAGIKTGSLFSCPITDERELRESLGRLNRLLVKKGLRVLPLRVENGRALIYVYRPQRLKRDLSHQTAARLLNERNYTTLSSDRCVLELINRLKDHEEFPHEIGLFLGYPPEDVDGFITHRAANSKLAGTWKVYGNVDEAQKTFARYKKCTDVYRAHFADGTPIERLAVAEACHPTR